MAELTRGITEQVIQLWKENFPGFAVITMPSQDGVLTLTHGMDMPLLKINNFPSKSPLSNNGLFSTEVSKDRFLTLYEVMLPDIPGPYGERSTADIYVKAIEKAGMDTAGVHFHWWASSVFPGKDHGVTAVHHQAIGMNPVEFSQKTIQILQQVSQVIMQRVAK